MRGAVPPFFMRIFGVVFKYRSRFNFCMVISVKDRYNLMLNAYKILILLY